jgi:hypothetical protein
MVIVGWFIIVLPTFMVSHVIVEGISFRPDISSMDVESTA